MDRPMMHDSINDAFQKRMTERKNVTPFLIYPENKLKSLWDFIMTIVLLVSCVITPLDIAFST